jgi:hypothetical protein
MPHAVSNFMRFFVFAKTFAKILVFANIFAKRNFVKMHFRCNPIPRLPLEFDVTCKKVNSKRPMNENICLNCSSIFKAI